MPWESSSSAFRLLPAHNVGGPPQADEPGQAPETQRLYYADLLKACAKVDEIVIWEGLPNPFSERALFEHEQKFAGKFLIANQLFYAQPLKVIDVDLATISDAVLEHRDNFEPWSGIKFCGGFHADYAIEWRYHHLPVAFTLFCFGCGEVQFRSGDHYEQADMSAMGHNRFSALLSRYRELRPKHNLAPTDTEKQVSIGRPEVPLSKIIVPPLYAPEMGSAPAGH